MAWENRCLCLTLRIPFRNVGRRFWQWILILRQISPPASEQRIGFKFKPWQAIKITKGIAIGGQVLSALGVGFSVFMQIKADQDEERIREDLKNNRQNIRSQFNVAANELEDYARQYIKDNVNRPLETSIATIDGNIQEIRDTRSNRSAACRQLEDLQKECRLLIQDIHSENEAV